MIKNLHNILLYVAMAMVLALSCASCNKDNDDDDTTTTTTTIYSVSTTSTLVTKFALKANDDVMEHLDSVFFTIDQDNALIYNADSLPIGTDVGALLTSVSFGTTVSAATFTMTGGTHRADTTINYTTSSTDSIDFTGKVTLTVTSATSGVTRDYNVKVLVHKQEPDSLAWPTSDRRDLPGTENLTTTNGGIAHTLLWDYEFYCFVKTNDKYILSTTDDPLNGPWEQKTPNFTGGEPTAFASTTDALYYMDSEGVIYKSLDGVDWSEVDNGWQALIGGYNDMILGLRKNDESDVLLYAQYPARDLDGSMADDAFPVKDFSQLVMADNSWVTGQQAMIAGGCNKDGVISDAVWGFDGEKWGRVNAATTSGLPALQNPTLISYYSASAVGSGVRVATKPTWYIIGGKTTSDTYNEIVYISRDQGIHWAVADDALQLPVTMPDLCGADAYVYGETLTTTLRAPRRISTAITSWLCPYIYLFGGYFDNEQLSPYIWRGVYNRLAQVPIY